MRLWHLLRRHRIHVVMSYALGDLLECSCGKQWVP